MRLSVIALDLYGDICLLCLRSPAIRPTQTASDGRRPLHIIWKPGFSLEMEAIQSLSGLLVNDSCYQIEKI